MPYEGAEQFRPLPRPIREALIIRSVTTMMTTRMTTVTKTKTNWTTTTTKHSFRSDEKMGGGKKLYIEWGVMKTKLDTISQFKKRESNLKSSRMIRL